MEEINKRGLKRNYLGIDILKLVMSLLVVVRHLDLGNDYLTAITCCAVPTFFMCSGFFARVSSDKLNKEYVLRQTKRLLLLYFVWAIIYLPLNIIGYRKSSFRDAIIDYLKNFFFSGEYWHMWYIPALIVAILLFYFLNKRIRFTYLVIISILLFIIGLFGDSYCILLEKYNPFLFHILEVYRVVFITTRNGLFLGLFCFMLGYTVTPQKKKKVNFLIYFVALLLGIVGSSFEIYFLKTVSGGVMDWLNILICPIIVGYVLFSMAVYLSGNLRENVKLAHNFRSLSTLIYTTHIMIFFAVDHILHLSGIISIIAKVAIPIIVAEVIYIIIKHFKFLKVLV